MAHIIYSHTTSTEARACCADTFLIEKNSRFIWFFGFQMVEQLCLNSELLNFDIVTSLNIFSKNSFEKLSWEKLLSQEDTVRSSASKGKKGTVDHLNLNFFLIL